MEQSRLIYIGSLVACLAIGYMANGINEDRYEIATGADYPRLKLKIDKRTGETWVLYSIGTGRDNWRSVPDGLPIMPEWATPEALEATLEALEATEKKED